jgi:hypothetical protein
MLESKTDRKNELAEINKNLAFRIQKDSRKLFSTQELFP